tara:strand:+ start:46 stop:291 length:246 start_codon:yes stop_codon:yes gene_type:complete
MTFQQREYIIKGYDYEEGDYFTFTLYIKDISADRMTMYAYAIYKWDNTDGELTSRPDMLKIEKKEGHEYTRHPYIKGRIYS